jgi:hypothetical protein
VAVTVDPSAQTVVPSGPGTRSPRFRNSDILSTTASETRNTVYSHVPREAGASCLRAVRRSSLPIGRTHGVLIESRRHRSGKHLRWGMQSVWNPPPQGFRHGSLAFRDAPNRFRPLPTGHDSVPACDARPSRLFGGYSPACHPRGDGASRSRARSVAGSLPARRDPQGVTPSRVCVRRSPAPVALSHGHRLTH